MTACRTRLFTRISILVVDGQYGFGNNRVMPVPIGNPWRIYKAGSGNRGHQDGFGLCHPYAQQLPILAARFVPAAGDDDISGRPVVAFAGIGEPKFSSTRRNGMRSGHAIRFRIITISLPMRLCNLSIRPRSRRDRSYDEKIWCVYRKKPGTWYDHSRFGWNGTIQMRSTA